VGKKRQFKKKKPMLQRVSKISLGRGKRGTENAKNKSIKEDPSPFCPIFCPKFSESVVASYHTYKKGKSKR
jgi:hypothetical protein